MTVGIQAINQFINQRAAGDRLVIIDDELHLVNKSSISGWQWFQAQFGYGPSVKNVAKYVNAHRNELFPEETKEASLQNKNDFNAFIEGYNGKRTSCLKVARTIKDLDIELFTFFGKKEWKKVGVKVKDAPPAPSKETLKVLYNTPCDIWPGKTLGETRMIFLVPKYLENGEHITHNGLGLFTQKFCPDPYMFHAYANITNDSDNHKNITESYYVMMTKDVIPESLGQDYSEDLIPELYDAPTMIEANVGLLTQYLRGRKLTMYSHFLFQKHSTMCKEVDERGHRAVAGSCDQNSYRVSFHCPNGSNVGLALVKKL